MTWLVVLIGEGAAIILIAGLLGIAALAAARRLFAPVGAIAPPAEASLAVAVVTALAVVGLSAARARLAFRRDWLRAIGLRSPGWRTIPWAALLIPAWPAIQLGWVWLVARLAGVPETLPVPGGGQGVLFTAWLILLAPTAEEMLFRGYFDARACRLVGAVPSFALTAVLFVASHAGSGLPQLFAVAPLALATGFLRRRTETLWAPLALHALSNATLLLRALLG